MFDTLFVRPVLNVLIAIYALIPGHNFGVALILFTVLARIVLWPLVTRQLHHAKAMRELQPYIKEVKANTKGDKQAQAAALMALYKEREVNPMSGLGYLVVQIPILIALYKGVNDISAHPANIIERSYGFVADLSWMKTLAVDPSKFDPTFLGLVDLTDKAFGVNSVNITLLVIGAASALVQFLSSKQLLASQGEKKSMRALLKSQAEGAEVDQAEMMMAISQTTMYFIPVMVFIVSLGLVGALPFYWLVNGTIAYFQQRRALSGDVKEMIEMTDDEPGSEKSTKSSKTKTSAKSPVTPAPKAAKNVVTDGGITKKLNAKEKKLARQAQQRNRGSQKAGKNG